MLVHHYNNFKQTKQSSIVRHVTINIQYAKQNNAPSYNYFIPSNTKQKQNENALTQLLFYTKQKLQHYNYFKQNKTLLWDIRITNHYV